MTADAGLLAHDLEPPSKQLNPFDLLASPRLLMPQYRPLINAFTPEGRAELARRSAEAEAESARNLELLDAARAEHGAACRRAAGNAPALAVLGIHRPDGSGYSLPYCTECREDGYSDAGDSVEWPCRTYLAVTGEAV